MFVERSPIYDKVGEHNSIRLLLTVENNYLREIILRSGRSDFIKELKIEDFDIIDYAKFRNKHYNYKCLVESFYKTPGETRRLEWLYLDKYKINMYVQFNFPPITSINEEEIADFVETIRGLIKYLKENKIEVKYKSILFQKNLI